MSTRSLAGLLIGALAGAGLLLTTAAHANLIADGSFETPIVTPGTFMNFSGGSALGAWTAEGVQVSIVSGSFVQGFNFLAEDGAQWLDLTGFNANSTTNGVQQTVATNPGTNYTLTYFVGNIVGGIFGTSSTVDLSINGTPSQVATNSGGAGQNNQVWEQFSFTFTASSPSTTFLFRNGDPANDNSNGLDNIVLVAASTSLPEPATLALLGIAFAGIGLARRRKLH